MNNKMTQALVLAAATLFSAGFALANDKPATEGTIKCSGANSCKGTSACKTHENSCKGQNACKGHGFTMETAKACTEKGGHELK
jgi:hypothetical protein